MKNNKKNATWSPEVLAALEAAKTYNAKAKIEEWIESGEIKRWVPPSETTKKEVSE